MHADAGSLCWWHSSICLDVLHLGSSVCGNTGVALDSTGTSRATGSFGSLRTCSGKVIYVRTYFMSQAPPCSL